jgi:hypothetical protein
MSNWFKRHLFVTTTLIFVGLSIIFVLLTSSGLVSSGPDPEAAGYLLGRLYAFAMIGVGIYVLVRRKSKTPS